MQDESHLYICTLGIFVSFERRKYIKLLNREVDIFILIMYALLTVSGLRSLFHPRR